MKRAQFSLGITATTLATTVVPASVIAATRKQFRKGKPYPASDGYRPRGHKKAHIFSAKSPFGRLSATTKIPVEKTFGPPRFFAFDEDGKTVTRVGQSPSQRQAEANAMMANTTGTLYVNVDVLYVNASSYFENRQKEIIQLKPTATQVKELPELSSQQTLSWSAVLKVDLKDNVAGKMLHTKIDAAALTSLKHMPIVNGVGLFSIPYVGTANHLNHALEKIDDALSTLNSLAKIAGGIPGVLIDAATIGAFTTAQSVVDQLIVLFAEGKATNEEAFSGDSVLFAVMQGAPAAMAEDTIRIPSGGQTYILVPGGDPTSNETPQSDDFERAVQGKTISQASSGRLVAEGEASNYFDLFNYAIVGFSVSAT